MIGDGLDALAAEVMASGGDVMNPGPLMGGHARPWSQMGGSAERSAEQQGADRQAGFLPLTDLGNAERWHLRHGGDYRYCAEIGWLAWDGRRWSREDADTRLMDSVFDTVRAIQFEAGARRQLGEAWRAKLVELEQQHAAGAIDDGELAAGRDRLGECPDPVIKRTRDGAVTLASEKLAQHGRTSEGQARIKAMADLALSLVTVRLEALDSNPWAVNVMNGTLRIERWKGQGCAINFGPHRRDDLMTMLAPVEYDPAATCPRYDAFMAQVQPDHGIRQFLHAYAGYSLTGDTGEQKFVINYGPTGANGKSTWVDLLARIWGDYAITVNIALFMDTKMQNSNSPSPALAELPRKRMVATSEPEKGSHVAEAMVKLVTGGEPLQARHLNKPFFRYVPEFKVLMSQNPMPHLSSDGAIWRRVVIVGWTVEVPEAERDPDLKAKLWEERSGILNRVLDGLRDWAVDGLPKIDAIMEATATVRDVSDPLGRFLRVATVPDPAGKVNATQLHRTHGAWALFEGEKAWSEKGLAGAMRDKGFVAKKISTMWWLGLRLVRDEWAFATDDGGGAGMRRRATLGPRLDGVKDEWDALPPDAGGEGEGFPE
jgi:P4 family phage/plasmid primase-like protien